MRISHLAYCLAIAVVAVLVVTGSVIAQTNDGAGGGNNDDGSASDGDQDDDKNNQPTRPGNTPNKPPRPVQLRPVPVEPPVVNDGDSPRLQVDKAFLRRLYQLWLERQKGSDTEVVDQAPTVLHKNQAVRRLLSRSQQRDALVAPERVQKTTVPKDFIDSDQDGVIDIDEEEVYDIDPTTPTTNEESIVLRVSATEILELVTDKEKLLAGYNPRTNVKLTYEDPRQTTVSTISSAYYVDEAVATNEASQVTMRGTAPPFSFVTLYIFSSPIVVTVQASAEGTWEYELDQELPSGKHLVYAGTVDGEGQVVARSLPYSFIKTAQATTAPVTYTDLTNTEAPEIWSNTTIGVMSVSLAAALLILIISTSLYAEHVRSKREL